MVKDLEKLGLWKNVEDPVTKRVRNPMKDRILANGGSIQENFEDIPKNIRELYQTISDIKVGDLTKMARDRACFIDQSQSLNVYYKNSKDMMMKMSRYLLIAWQYGLKTGVYYTRTIQKLQVIDSTKNLDAKPVAGKKERKLVYTGNEEDHCVSCSG